MQTFVWLSQRIHSDDQPIFPRWQIGRQGEGVAIANGRPRAPIRRWLEVTTGFTILGDGQLTLRIKQLYENTIACLDFLAHLPPQFQREPIARPPIFPCRQGITEELEGFPAAGMAEAGWEGCETLLRLGGELGFGAQSVLYDGAASDAAGIKRAGLAGRTVAFGFPRDNSHGFEIAHRDALKNVTQLLVAYLRQLR